MSKIFDREIIPPPETYDQAVELCGRVRDLEGVDVVPIEPFSPPGRSCSLISVSSSFPSVTTMSQKSSVMQLPQFVPKASTSDS